MSAIHHVTTNFLYYASAHAILIVLHIILNVRIHAVFISPFYDGWSGGMFKLSSPVLGTSLLSSSNMDNICQKQFGSSFTAANHHMGRYVPEMSISTFFYDTWPTSTSAGGWVYISKQILGLHI